MKKRTIQIIIAAFLWILSFYIIYQFTSATGEESDSLSLAVAHRIENVVADHFYVNHHDVFWEDTLNAIIRKCGHFVEFAFAGLSACIFFMLLIRKKWKSVLVSFGVCSFMALLDEFRQQFVAGRSPRWFDVQIDITGAIFGILVVIIIYCIYLKIKNYKDRISELEKLSIK